MDNSKLSEEQIIKLGKRIVEELKLHESVNTLGRWMSHYLAELIEKADICQDAEERKTIQNDCKTLILNLWEKRETVPGVSAPLDNLEGMIDILRVFAQNEKGLPFWESFGLRNQNSGIGSFIETVKMNSENIFRIGLLLELNKELIDKKKEWIEKNAELLSEEEKNFLTLFTNLISTHQMKNLVSQDSKEIELLDLEKHERYELIFDKMENEIKEMLEELEKLRKTKA